MKKASCLVLILIAVGAVFVAIVKENQVRALESAEHQKTQAANAAMDKAIEAAKDKTSLASQSPFLIFVTPPPNSDRKTVIVAMGQIVDPINPYQFTAYKRPEGVVIVAQFPDGSDHLGVTKYQNTSPCP